MQSMRNGHQKNKENLLYSIREYNNKTYTIVDIKKLFTPIIFRC